MKNSTQLKNTLLALTAATLLSACAPRGSNSGVSDLSSRVTDPTASSTKSTVYCNQATGTDITAKLRAYVNNDKTVRLDYMVVRLSALPSTFKTDKSYITMWKWLASTAGGSYMDTTPLNFIIMNPATGLAVTDWKSTVRWADISTAATSLGYSDAQSFFNAMKIVVDLKDTTGEYDVLKITNYDVTTNKALSEVDALLPMFYANPTDYALEPTGTARASVLQVLHPFKKYADKGYTTSQFVSMATNFCF